MKGFSITPKQTVFLTHYKFRVKILGDAKFVVFRFCSFHLVGAQNFFVNNSINNDGHPPRIGYCVS